MKILLYSGLCKSYLCCFISLLLLSYCQIDSNNAKTKEMRTFRDDSVRVILEDIYDSDQDVRKQFYTGQPITDEMMREMYTVDSINWQRAKSLLSSYGFPKSSRVGEKASKAAFYIVQHGDSALMETYIDTIELLASIGEAKLTNAALMRDRVLMNRNEKQIYGTQAMDQLNPLDLNRVYIWPVAEPNSVDSIRRRAGFELSIEESAEQLKAIYDPRLELPNPKLK